MLSMNAISKMVAIHPVSKEYKISLFILGFSFFKQDINMNNINAVNVSHRNSTSA